MATAPLKSIIESAVNAAGYQLWGYELASHDGVKYLRVYAEGDDGIGMDGLTKITHQLSALLDVEDPIQGRYQLEVSSPGLQRSLFELAQYQHCKGSLIKLKLRQARDGRRNFKGVIEGVADDNVILNLEGEQLHIPYAQIEKAHLVYEG